jgi:HlyD family type I secretion membrane fusion protein
MKLLEGLKGNDTSENKDDIDTNIHTNSKPIMLIGFSVLILGFIGFIVWASLASFINGIGVPGVVTVSSQENIIQSRYGGTIKDILVHDGDTVKKNQTLMVLNDSQQKSNLAAAKSEYIADLALYARLRAENTGASNITFPPELLSFKNSAQAQEAMATQRQLFNSKRINFKADENILKVNIKGFRDYIENIRELKRSTANQITLAKKEMKPLKKLAKEGYYPKVKIIYMENTIQELEGKLNEETGSITRAEQSMAEYQLKLDDLRNNFSKEVNMHLSAVQKRVFALKQGYLSAFNQFAHSTIKSSVDGIVVKTYIKTIGGVIMPGQPIIDILPLNQNLIIKANVPTQDIAHVRKGLTANLRFPAFNIESTPVINGKVIYVSANSLVDKANNMAYYVCKIKIDKKGLKTLARLKLKLKAGMPVQATVKTGKRTLMSYIMKPLLDKISHAFVR